MANTNAMLSLSIGATLEAGPTTTTDPPRKILKVCPAIRVHSTKLRQHREELSRQVASPSGVQNSGQIAGDHSICRHKRGGFDQLVPLIAHKAGKAQSFAGITHEISSRNEIAAIGACDKLSLLIAEEAHAISPGDFARLQLFWPAKRFCRPA